MGRADVRHTAQRQARIAITFALPCRHVRCMEGLATLVHRMMLVLEDLKTHRERALALGFWALVVYRFGHARFVIRNKILRAPWTLVYIVLHKLVEIFFGISIGSTARIGRRFEIEHHGCIVIHGAAEIGDDCLIRQGVTIGNSGADDPLGAPKIGNRVHIGAGAKLIGRITIGDDVIVGANAVVIRDVPSAVIVAGVPAIIKKQRFANGA
jgi:serine O-acetyltransferase